MIGKTPFGVLLSHANGTSPFHFQLAPWERWLLATALFAVGLVPVAGVLAQGSTSRAWSMVGFCSGVLAVALAVVHQVTTLVIEARKLGDPARMILTRLDQRFAMDQGLIDDLAAAYSADQLEHARDGLGLEITQTRHRVGFLLGVVEQLGLVPSAAAGFFFARKLYVEKEVTSLTLTLIFTGVAGLYVSAPLFLMATQRLERLSLALRHAAERKRRATSAPKS